MMLSYSFAKMLLTMLFALVVLATAASPSSSSWLISGGTPQRWGQTPNTIGSGSKVSELFRTSNSGGFAAEGLVLSNKTGLLYVAVAMRESYYRSYLVAFRKTNGSKAWSAMLSNDFFQYEDYATAPALSADESIVYSAAKQKLFAFDSATGKQLWNVSAPNGGPVVDSLGVVYVAGDRFQAKSAPTSNIAAFDGKTGQQLWSTPVVDFGKLAPCVLDEDEKVCVTGTTANRAGSTVYAVSLHDGSLLWKKSYSTGAVYNPVTSYSLIRNGRVYVPMASLGVVVIDIATGKTLYNGSNTFRNDYPGATAAVSLLVSQDEDQIVTGMQYGFTSVSYNFCLSGSTADLSVSAFGRFGCVGGLKIQSDSFPVSTQPLLTADNIALVAIGDNSRQWDRGQLRAYRLNTAPMELLWSVDATVIDAQPIVDADGTIYAVDRYGRLHAFRVTQ